MVTGPSLLALALMGAGSMDKGDFEQRRKDWRNGAVVYQVFVDRFVPSAHLEEKRALYRSPQTLRKWEEVPTPRFDPATKSYPHVFDFWGGDLPSLQSKLDYVQKLGADVVYPLPIFESPSNHKYDTRDYFKVDPQYGTEQDLKNLISDLHRRKMRIMLDGVFNHIGSTAPIFTDGKHADWFYLGDKYPNGYLGWAGVASLPRLNLPNRALRDYLWNGKNSVVRHYLNLGIDGWRLDVAFELGPDYLGELTRAAHSTKRDSWIVGEISGFPADWSPSVDGTYNFTPTALGREMLQGHIRGGQVGQSLQDMVDVAGIEPLLKSWLLTDNHDTSRFATTTPDPTDRHLLRALQLTLPGSPCLYYGSELGMEGAGDPGCRAPMRWDLVNDSNPDLRSTRTLLEIRKRLPALRFGDFRALRTDRLLGYVRTTDRTMETAIVVVNPTSESVTEAVAVPVGRLMSWGLLKDLVTGNSMRVVEGVLKLSMPAKSVMILSPEVMDNVGYSPYERIDHAERKKGNDIP